MDPTRAPRTVWLHPAAPPKPAADQACNGCGLCCAAEPCPLGMLLSGRRTGACRQLQWSAAAGRYHCGVLARARPGGWWQRLLQRWVAAGQGCDCTLQPQA
jgi:hypothetical protein